MMTQADPEKLATEIYKTMSGRTPPSARGYLTDQLRKLQKRTVQWATYECPTCKEKD